MKHVFTAAVLCISMFAAQAQTPPAKTAPAQKPAAAAAHPAHNCMLVSDKDWASLNMNADQTAKVKAIREECMKDCGAMMKTDPKIATTMDKHEAKVKALLTPAQYDSWMKVCAAQSSAPAMKK